VEYSIGKLRKGRWGGFRGLWVRWFQDTVGGVKGGMKKDEFICWVYTLRLPPLMKWKQRLKFFCKPYFDYFENKHPDSNMPANTAGLFD